MFWAVVWYYLLVIFTIADIITTKIGLSIRGFYEGNPLMINFTGNIIEMKIIVLLLGIIVVVVYEKMRKGEGWVPLSLGTFITAMTVIQNIVRISGMI